MINWVCTLFVTACKTMVGHMLVFELEVIVAYTILFSVIARGVLGQSEKI